VEWKAQFNDGTTAKGIIQNVSFVSSTQFNLPSITTGIDGDGVWTFTVKNGNLSSSEEITVERNIVPISNNKIVHPFPNGWLLANDRCQLGSNCSNSTAHDHLGIDLMGAKGSTIVSMCDGKVILNNTSSASLNGSLVIVEHDCEGKKYYGYYGHVASNLITNRDIKAGDTIGVLKDWGSNSHLHMGLSNNKHTLSWGYDINKLTDFIDFRTLLNGTHIPAISTKPIINSVNVRDTGSQGDGKVRITYSVSTDTSLRTLRTHCGLYSGRQTYNYPEYRDSSLSGRSIDVTLQNSNWVGKRVYCKVEAMNTASQKADIKSDYVTLSEKQLVVPSIKQIGVKALGDSSTGSKFRFIVELTGKLPTGYYIYINFNDPSAPDWLGIEWYYITQAGGHQIVSEYYGNVYFEDRIIKSSGSDSTNRYFRVGIFKGTSENESYNMSGYTSGKQFTVTK
jgi:murein DD-endopeptidase MepM/ murein hydrolase activator NlpD